MKVGIIGYGFVGQAVHAILDDRCTVAIYDLKEKYKKNRLDAFKSHIIFVCVNTENDADGVFDDSNVTSILEQLKGFKGTIVIKSTIPYEFLQPFESKLNIVFNPEFLNQNTYISDSLNQDTVLLGGEVQDLKEVFKFYDEYTLIEPECQYTSLKVACDFKYTRNLYGAYKVLFWEFIQDTTGNSRKMAELFNKMPYQSEMDQVGMDGFRGFGGACFPKDVQAWDELHKHELTTFMLNYNKKF